MRRPDPTLLAQGALYIAATAAVLAVGIDLGFRLDEPKTEIRTIVHEIPPACEEIGHELQAERARSEQLDAVVDAVSVESEELAAVALTADPDAIVEQAKRLDDAKRTEQQLRLDLAADVATTNAVVGDCAPEVDR